MTYTPILTGKAGEFAALEGLTTDVLDQLSPYIDMAPYDDRGNTPPEQRLNDLLKLVTAPWAMGRKVTIDLTTYDQLPIDGLHAVEWFMERSCMHPGQVDLAIPTDASEQYIDAVIGAGDRAAGRCLRARVPPGASPSDTATAIERIRARLAEPASELDLIIDLSRIADHDARLLPELTALARSHLDAAPDTLSWRTLTLASTDAPTGPIRRDNPYRTKRRDWRLWTALRRANLPRTPSFGDYGITGPRQDKAGGRAPAPNLRYTAEDALYIWRGYRAKELEEADSEPPKPHTFPELCYELIHESDDVYLGSDYSPGDLAYLRVLDPAFPNVGPGNAQQWVQWATSHHVSHVAVQITAATD